MSLEISTLSELGTFHSSLVDVLDDLVASGCLHIEGSPIVLDVGANVGQFAAAIKVVSRDSRIISFEPDPITFARLVRNMGSVPGVTLFQTALGDRTTDGVLYRHELPIMSSLRPAGTGYDPSRSVQVPVRRLDEIDIDDGVIDLLKIDVEGFELEALLGAAGILDRVRFLLLELSLSRPGGSSNLELLRTIAERCPSAQIVRTGRPLGQRGRPVCQDVLIRLRLL